MILLWWLSETEYRFIGDKLPKDFPEYLRAEYVSRCGRPGRGRLWVDDDIKGPVKVDPWPDTPLGEMLGHEHSAYGGLALLSHHRCFIRNLPGIVTDLELNQLASMSPSEARW